MDMSRATKSIVSKLGQIKGFCVATLSSRPSLGKVMKLYPREWSKTFNFSRGLDKFQTFLDPPCQKQLPVPLFRLQNFQITKLLGYKTFRLQNF